MKEIDSIIAAVRALGPDAACAKVHIGHDRVEITIRASTSVAAAVFATRFGCTDRRVAGGAGYAWEQYRNPDYWDAPVAIEVSGPHWRVKDEERAA